MTEAVRRTFRVGVPLHEAWARFSEVDRWPEWAPHITAASLTPPGPLGPSSSGALRIRGLGRSTFRMTVWEPPLRWVWVGGLPGTRITYEHGFAADGDTATTFEWVVSLEGPLAWLVRPVFARIYARNVDRVNRLHAHLVVLAPGYRRELPRELTEPGQIGAAPRLIGRQAGGAARRRPGGDQEIPGTDGRDRGTPEPDPRPRAR